MTSACLFSTKTTASNTSSWYVALPLVLSAALGGLAPQIAYAQVDCSTVDTDRVSCAEVGDVNTGWFGWWQSFDSGAVADRAVQTVTAVLENNGGASSADGIYLEVFSGNSTPNACNANNLAGLVGTSASRSIPDTNGVKTAFDFTFPATTELSPNTTYYVRLVDPDPSGGQTTVFSEDWDTGDAGGAGNNCGEVAHAIYMQAADADGDGVVNTLDAFPNDPSETTDSDGDGVGDNRDEYPNDPTKWALAVPVMPWLALLLMAGLLGLIGARRGRV